MSRLRLFHPVLLPGPVELSTEESHHAASVLRCKVGDVVALFDGEGNEAGGTVATVGRRVVTVDVRSVEAHPFDGWTRLTLAVAMPRKQRQAFLFEKCTELGVWGIWPTVCERSVVRPGGDQVEKWRRTMIESAKQCGRSWVPRIERPMTFEETVSRAGAFDRWLVTDADTSRVSSHDTSKVSSHDTSKVSPSDTSGVSQHDTFGVSLSDTIAADRAAERGRRPRSILIWIGPEGGLSASEIDRACSAGAVRASLGRNVLRIETAAVAATAVVMLGPCGWGGGSGSPG